jgi:hypothetical protein
VKPVIESFIHPDHFPTTYGGNLEWKWGELPTLDPSVDEAVEWCNGFTRFPLGPMYWRPIEGDPDHLECWGVGTEKGEDRRIRICTIKRTYKGPEPHPPKAEEPVANGEPVPPVAADAAADPKPQADAPVPAPVAAPAADNGFLPLTSTPGEAVPPPADAATSQDAAKADPAPAAAIEALTLTDSEPAPPAAGEAVGAGGSDEKAAEKMKAEANGAPVQGTAVA